MEFEHYFAISLSINLLASGLDNLAPSPWPNSLSRISLTDSGERFFLAIKAKIIRFCLSVILAADATGFAGTWLLTGGIGWTGAGFASGGILVTTGAVGG